MKNILASSLLFISAFSSAQEVPRFALTKDGVEPIVVVIDSLTASELYRKTSSWIRSYYENPKAVIKTDVENEMIKIEDVEKNAWLYSGKDIAIYYDVEYIFYIDFKYNQITMSIDFGNTWDHNSGKAAQSYYVNYKKLWRENGEVHSIYKETKQGIDQMMNELSFSLINYLREDHTNSNSNNNKSDLLRMWQKIKSKAQQMQP